VNQGFSVSRGTSLRLAPRPWPDTTGKYGRNTPGLCSPQREANEGGRARRLTVLNEASESGRDLSRCEERGSPIVADANSLIDLIKLDTIRPVTKMSDYRLIIVDEVVEEIRRPNQVKILESIINDGSVFRVSLITAEELALFTRLQAILDLGESASLSYASLHGCFFLSDETQRAFMRETVALIGEDRLIRTPCLLARAIKSHRVSPSNLKIHLEMLKRTAATPRDRDDVVHLQRILERAHEMAKGEL